MICRSFSKRETRAFPDLFVCLPEDMNDKMLSSNQSIEEIMGQKEVMVDFGTNSAWGCG